jgi:NTP pyrophosphatase (non-canonical NTP hydrolase)
VTDATTVVATLREQMAAFVAERQWEKYHSPKNLAMALAAEAAELMEHFLWLEPAESRTVLADAPTREAVADELADVACLLLALSNATGIDLSSAFQRKMAKNVVKYPAARCRGHFRVIE